MATATPTRRVSNSASQTPVKRVTLADSIRGGRHLPSRIVFHGQGGIGKTSWAAHAPNPIFLLSPGETGLHTLADAGLVPATQNVECSDWDSLFGLIEELTTTDHDYKSVVLDTIDGFEKLCNQHVCDTDFGGDWGEKGFMGYQRGYKVAAAGPWRGLLAALDKLRVAKSVFVICLAHTGIGNFANPEGPDYNRWLPDMAKDAWAVLNGWADMVLFGQQVVEVVKEKGNRKSIGASNGDRILSTEWRASADAKNRHNLPSEIDMGTSGKEAWDNFKAAVLSGRKQSTEGDTSNG